MERRRDVEAAAEVFKVLGNPSRLDLVRLLGEGPLSVTQLAERSGLRQPMVSQHLRTLRQADLVAATRSGSEVRYAVADEHVLHIVVDAVAHAHESHDDHD
ncbi:MULTISPECIES: ArsR/SmtB family transcription factor [unclassified Agrococcus]|uniref:ArsR/SmtB family transcription factor n=1 Tax=unclassified Agrococcus TaxID=2615065 RepID=UPI003622C792